MEDCAEETCQPPIQDIAIESAIKHEKYSYQKNVNDIALLRLKRAADTSKTNVDTICLPTTEESQIDRVDQIFLKKMIIAGN